MLVWCVLRQPLAFLTGDDRRWSGKEARGNSGDEGEEDGSRRSFDTDGGVDDVHAGDMAAIFHEETGHSIKYQYSAFPGVVKGRFPAPCVCRKIVKRWAALTTCSPLVVPGSNIQHEVTLVQITKWRKARRRAGPRNHDAINSPLVNTR
jgi:hypothetical protein